MNNFKRLLRYDLPLHFILVITNILPDLVIMLRFRGYLISPFLGKCGKNLRVGRSVTFYNAKNIEIGDDVYIGYGSWFSAGDKIRIGNQVLIGPYCKFASSNHSLYDKSYRFGKPINAPINIGFGSWLGGAATLTAGVTVGSTALIGANTVVTKDIPECSVVGGVPAKIIKSSKKVTK